jgi:hypothetical protein
VSRLRAKCPDCKTFTAVALGSDYECHACGRVFHSGLVRVPQAWGDGGEAMAEAAWLELPYPETGVVEAESLEEQSLALAADLPERPLILGGCCCSHDRDASRSSGSTPTAISTRPSLRPPATSGECRCG